MATKKVTFIQAKDNAGVRKVRIDDVEVDVVSAMPTIINGQIAVTMTLVGVDLSAETEATKPPPRPRRRSKGRFG